jgi:hypothetical protein
LKDLAAAPDKVLRMLVVFSEGVGGTTTVSEDVADQATALGIPIYPVMVNYQKISNSRGLGGGREPGAGPVPQPMIAFERLGALTGGLSFEPYDMDVSEVRDILEAVKNEGLSQYVAGFVPQPLSGRPREHKLEIRLASKSSGKLLGGRRKAIY